jgi:hypothetical protein
VVLLIDALYTLCGLHVQFSLRLDNTATEKKRGFGLTPAIILSVRWPLGVFAESPSDSIVSSY